MSSNEMIERVIKLAEEHNKFADFKDRLEELDDELRLVDIHFYYGIWRGVRARKEKKKND